MILGGHHEMAPLSDRTYRRIAREHRTYLLEDLWEEFRGRAGAVDISLLESETTQGAIERIKQEAVKKVRDGAELLVLTDRTVYDGDRRYLDPHLATSAVDQALKQFRVEPGEENLRRRCGIVLRSAAIRNVHDTMLALGLGANGVCPYTMVEVICVEDYETDVSNLCAALTKGIEKVISTIGIHEVRGYARQFSSIGVKPELAEIFQTEAFAASETGGVGFAELDEDTNERAPASWPATRTAKPAKTFRFYPKVYKAAIATANGVGSYEEYSEKVRELERQSPISMRHVMGLSGRPGARMDAGVVDAGVGHHDYPIVISSMSFGSQSEPAFRAYAEAAKAINILCINGEGGEIRDMYGRYRKWRGQQVASGRFGVSAEMINSSYLAEIKIGQGAKPGEGGHLPGKKVSEKVAAARNAAPGTDLISPSNNHDLYSIEDLAELIDELKTVNPDVRVSVKVPVVPNIGTIGLGIAKAGADIITLSGFEGGTGAARQHALRHVGLPSDIGTRAVHRALMEAGIRNRVEIWADGGYRTGYDIVKLHCLGANRVGFGTLAMVSLGCTICRGCQLDTCHVGIATQIETVEQAQQHGLKKFTPQERRAGRRELRPLLHGDGRGGQGGGGLARLRARPGPGRPLRPAGAGLPPRDDRPGAVDHAAGGVPRPRAARPAGRRGDRRGARRGRPRRRPPDPDGGQAGLGPDRRPGGRRLPGAHRAQSRSHAPPTPATASSAPSWPGRSPGRGSSTAAPSRARRCSPASSSTAARSPARGSAPSTTMASRSGSRAAPRTASARRCGAASIAVLKGKGAKGRRLNGSVGKSFAYGAQRGRLFVQGSADSRFCIRLSGADVVLAGEPERDIDDSRGCIVDRANAKGFAFEYMTSGRAIVLGDIGPWACAGMTGGRVYVRHNAFGIDREAIERRLGEGAKVELQELDAEGLLDVDDLLTRYAAELRATGQDEEADRVTGLAAGRRPQLPDGRSAQGPGGPEHLDRVATPARRSAMPRTSRSRLSSIASMFVWMRHSA